LHIKTISASTINEKNIIEEENFDKDNLVIILINYIIVFIIQ